MADPRLRVHVVPGAKKTELAGLHGEAIRIRCAVPPEDGRANWAVRELLATLLDVPVRDVTIARGERSRDKVIEVAGVAPEDARARLTIR